MSGVVLNVITVLAGTVAGLLFGKAIQLADAGYTFLVIRFDEEKSLDEQYLLTRITQAISEKPS